MAENLPFDEGNCSAPSPEPETGNRPTISAGSRAIGITLITPNPSTARGAGTGDTRGLAGDLCPQRRHQRLDPGNDLTQTTSNTAHSSGCTPLCPATASSPHHRLTGLPTAPPRETLGRTRTLSMVTTGQPGRRYQYRRGRRDRHQRGPRWRHQTAGAVATRPVPLAARPPWSPVPSPPARPSEDPAPSSPRRNIKAQHHLVHRLNRVPHAGRMIGHDRNETVFDLHPDEPLATEWAYSLPDPQLAKPDTPCNEALLVPPQCYR
jgi:hypothetical protein